MIRFNPLNPRTQCQMVRGFNGLKRIIADRVSFLEAAKGCAVPLWPILEVKRK